MTIPYISSVQNPLIKHLITLRDQKGRHAAGTFSAEGVRTCTTLTNSSYTLEQLIVTDALLDIAQTLTLDNIVVVSDTVMHKLSTATTPSGIIGIFRKPLSPSFDLLTEGIVLAQVADPGNMGTLIRTAAALNMRSVVVVEGVDPWSPKVIQSSAGAVGLVDIFECSWDELRQAATAQDVTLSALVVKNGTDPRGCTYSKRHLWVVGNEAHGLPEAWVAACDRSMTLPMPGNAESFNVAIAGSLALYMSYLQKSPYHKLV